MIDLDRLESLRADASADEEKYLDATKWLEGAKRRCQRAGLDKGPRRSVLDLGCGAGWFAYVASAHFGHDVVGLDLPTRSKLFRAVTDMLGISVIERELKPFEPLNVVRVFDVITAFQITFNGHREPPIWGVPEWMFLVRDLMRQCDEIHLELNREPSGPTMSTELRFAIADVAMSRPGNSCILAETTVHIGPGRM